MVVALGVLIAYQYLLNFFYPDWKPGQQAQNAQPTSQVAPATTQATSAPVVAPGTRASTGPTLTTAPSAVAGVWRVRGDDSTGTHQTLLGSSARDDKAWAMGVDLVRKGAAINAVTLNQFRKVAEDKNTPYTFEEPLQIGGQVREDTRSMMTRWVSIDGKQVDLSNAAWRLDSADAGSARFSVDLLNGDAHAARVVKMYRLSPRSEDPNSPQGFQVNVVHQVENLTDKPINVWMGLNGPTVPPRELEREIDQSFIFGYRAEGTILVVSHLLGSEFTKDHAWKEFTRSEKGLPLQWLGTQSAYFNAIARPLPRSAGAQVGWVYKVFGDLLNPDAVVEDQRVVQRLEADLKEIPAGGSAQVEFENYFGPKGRKVLSTPYYKAPERLYNETLVIKPTSGIAKMCAICTWQWLIDILVWMLILFHTVTRDWGLAIICLVLLVRALLHPITKKSQVHMVKMQKMGPEMEKLKKKFGDDKDALAKAQMQFYKEQGFTPILGCLPMFLQMPIWIALWNALQSTFELRHAPFLYGFTWIHDLAKPDYLVKFTNSIPLIFGIHLSGLNILPILMGAVFYLQMKYQPKPAAMTPEQAQQQKMMTWMSTLLFPLMLYTGPSGLNLYILTSTAFGILESKVIRKHIAEREALEALGPTIVDAPPPGKQGGKKDKEEPPKPKGWLARLQEKAEQIQKEQGKRKR